jgi:hypothetical protein
MVRRGEVGCNLGSADCSDAISLSETGAGKVKAREPRSICDGESQQLILQAVRPAECSWSQSVAGGGVELR